MVGEWIRGKGWEGGEVEVAEMVVEIGEPVGSEDGYRFGRTNLNDEKPKHRRGELLKC